MPKLVTVRDAEPALVGDVGRHLDHGRVAGDASVARVRGADREGVRHARDPLVGARAECQDGAHVIDVARVLHATELPGVDVPGAATPIRDAPGEGARAAVDPKEHATGVASDGHRPGDPTDVGAAHEGDGNPTRRHGARRDRPVSDVVSGPLTARVVAERSHVDRRPPVARRVRGDGLFLAGHTRGEGCTGSRAEIARNCEPDAFGGEPAGLAAHLEGREDERGRKSHRKTRTHRFVPGGTCMALCGFTTVHQMQRVGLTFP